MELVLMALLAVVDSTRASGCIFEFSFQNKSETAVQACLADCSHFRAANPARTNSALSEA
jgi:hypothetical protein